MSSDKKNNQNMRIYRPGILQVGRFEPTQRRLEPEKSVDRKHGLRKAILSLVFIVAAIGTIIHFTGDGKTVSYSSSKLNAKSSTAAPIAHTECSLNTKSKLIIVSLSQQQLWACSYQNVSFSSRVVTGYTGNPADVTPTGTYKIFTKETNVTLTGNDGTTTWHDPVSYWMPFLFNKYGAYGFHDATWRTPDQFGNISTNSPNASHGCVELPLATAKWLYGWVKIGTYLTIKQA